MAKAKEHDNVFRPPAKRNIIMVTDWLIVSFLQMFKDVYKRQVEKKNNAANEARRDFTLSLIIWGGGWTL